VNGLGTRLEEWPAWTLGKRACNASDLAELRSAMGEEWLLSVAVREHQLFQEFSLPSERRALDRSAILQQN
jgi:hypothetical protein